MRAGWQQVAAWAVAAGMTMASVAAGAAEAATSWDGLVPVKSSRLQSVFLAPGADFRPYRRVIIEPPQVAFHKDWMRTVNQRGATMTRRVTEEDAAEILAAARSNFDGIFREAFADAGYPTADGPGADTLRVYTGVVNLYVSAPNTPGASTRNRTYTADAGDATLVLELRDSTTGAILARVVDSRETQSTGIHRSTELRNVEAFQSMFREWGRISTRGLGELQRLSPLPAELRPGQKLD
jgi:hypothetical protein